MSKPTLGSLFAGIGGFDLGFERAGFETVWQVEIDPFCRRVLERHFPRAERFADIRECGSHNLGSVDVICGGFPCQDISNAGKCAGIEGERSGLWAEFGRIICELRPSVVVVENVSALLGRGMGRVLGDLAACGYDAEWDCIRAFDVGAPHLRDRIWIVAHPNGSGCGQSYLQREFQGRAEAIRDGQAVPDSAGWREQSSGTQGHEWRFQDATVRSLRHSDNWAVEPDVGRVAHGVPARVDRLRSLGNAVVPQIAQFIAERIKAVMDSERAQGYPQAKDTLEGVGSKGNAD